MQGISKSFPGVKALDRVDLTVDEGEVVAVCGENGAGKSTLMNVLGGVLQPDSGRIIIDGNEVRVRDVARAIDLGIGFIHQELNVLPNLTIAGNVFLGREPLWAGPLRLINRKSIRENTEPFLKRLGLDLSPDTLLSELSIAQKQLVEVAKALSLNARILIMDEPTSSLTVTESGRLFDVIRDIRSQGVSVIYISHRLNEIKEIADRVEVMRDGRNAGSLEAEQISHDNMVRMMIGRELSDFYVEPRSGAEPGYLSVKDLSTQAYPDVKISFEASKGEILGFAGLVGAGRSEMARAIFGVDRSVAGSICLGGETLNVGCPRDAIEQGIFLVPEDRRKSGLVVEMTVRENVTLPNLKGHVSKGIIRRNSEVAESEKQRESLNIKAPTVETLVKNLSGGNQQKVALAKWLALNPKAMIFDEPTRGVDVGAKSEIYHLIRDLADRGILVILISSDMEEILGVCDRIAVMCEGSIKGVLEREAFDEEAVMRLAVGQACN